MKKLSIVILISTFSLLTQAQSYQTAVGVRFGNVAGARAGGAGLNLKHFLSEKNALELTLGGGANHIRAQLLYEWQNPTNITDGLDWYIGVGGGLGLWSVSVNLPGTNNYSESGMFLGVDGVVGLDWNLESQTDIPLSVAIDLGPHIGLINSNRVGWGSALALRYIFK